ncbi:TFIIA-alpha and beta-like factor isoform X1 [Erinaceus europaeus]|uniref:TFIIA-alpha and beta-like factor isoform X1 n=1 Tax=Erinaceus europaeus TaxID=9365 RepID=A0A1S3AA21_ERIEU|nr:TFIIA-alpha and beta-like factor isoform X1 [Erinaceus europaeus]
MACINPVPQLYRSVIEDVIEGVRDLFAEEGIEDQVLKDLKQLWETKVLQSKATEDFFRNSVHSPLFTLQFPHGLQQTLQSSTASLVIPAGRTLPTFTTTELGTSNSSANFNFPGYPIPVPAGVTLQTASGHLYKVNLPIVVTQTPGRTNILQHPIQQVFQQLGQAPVIQTSVPRLNPCFLQAATAKSQRMETVLQQPTVLYPGMIDQKHLEHATGDILVPPGNEHKITSEALLSQPEGPQYVSFPGVVFPSQVSQTNSTIEPMLSASASMIQNLHGRPLSTDSQVILHQHRSDVLKNRSFGCDSVKQSRNTEEASTLPVSEKNSNSQRDLNIQVADEDDDVNEIIQIDGTGDTSYNDEIGSAKDIDENEFLGTVDSGVLKVLEEEADSISNEDSTVNCSDNEDPQVDIVEEDPLNSGDDVSEQDVPDLFDTDNVIVCQYDKIHRSKNKWKFYLKDGIMCFGGRDYVFAKAIGDAEW